MTKKHLMKNHSINDAPRGASAAFPDVAPFLPNEAIFQTLPNEPNSWPEVRNRRPHLKNVAAGQLEKTNPLWPQAHNNKGVSRSS